MSTNFYSLPYFFQDQTTFLAEQVNADLTTLLNAVNSLQTQVNTGSASGLPSFYVTSAATYGMSPSASAAQNMASLQLAVNTAIAAGGGTVFIPNGAYNISGTVIINGNPSTAGLIIAGSGTGTQLLQANPGSDTFQITGFSGGNGAGCHFRNLWFQYPDQATGSGIAVHITGGSQGIDCYECIFFHCPQAFQCDSNSGLQCGLRSCLVIQNKYSTPNVGQIDLGCAQGFVDGCLLRQNTGSGGGGPANNIGIRTNGSSIARITNCQISTFDYGIVIGGGTTSRVWVNSCQVEAAITGLTIQPTATKTIYGVYVSNTDFKMSQTSTNTAATGVYIDTNGGSVNNVENINFTNCGIYAWNGSGMTINAAKQVNIVGGLISANGQNPASTLNGCGVTLGSASGGPPTKVSLTGVDLQGTYDFVGGSNQPYAVGVYGNSDVVLSGCNVTLQGTGVFYTTGGSTYNIKAFNCLGYNDQNTAVSSSSIASTTPFSCQSLGYYGPATVYLSGSNTGMVVQQGVAATNLYGTLANSSVIPFTMPDPKVTTTLTYTGKGTINIIGG